MIGHIPKKDSSGLPLYASDKPSGSFSTKVTHNLCDNTTWAIGTNDSTWTLEPSANKKMSVAKAEIQFNHDLAMNGNSVVMNYYIWHPSFQDPIIGETIQFDNLYHMFELGNSHSHCPAIGTELPNGLTTIHFDYTSKLVLYSNRVDLELAKVEVLITGHTELGGSYCSAGFVTVEEDQ